MNRTRRTIKFIVLAVSVVLCALWMLFSTLWIADARNTEKLVEQEPLPSEMMGLSFYEATSFEQIDTLYDTIRCVGYVYNISDATDDEATRSMILNSQDVSYRIQLNEQSLDHVTTVTTELYANLTQTPKTYTGFDFDFCPLGMRDGFYKIILQVEEFGEPVTRVPTGYVVQKANGHAELHYKPSEPVERIGHTDETNYQIDAGFSSFQLLEDGTLNLAGWGLVVGFDASKQPESTRSDYGVYPWEHTFTWIAPEAQITLKGDEIKQHGLDLAFSSPLTLVSLTDDTTVQTTVTVNGEVMRTVVLEAGESYEISIPANELPDTDDGLYEIKLSTNGCYNPQTQDGSTDDRDLAVALTYVGAPFYPTAFDASKQSQLARGDFGVYPWEDTFSWITPEAQITLKGNEIEQYGLDLAFSSPPILIPFTDDSTIQTTVTVNGKMMRTVVLKAGESYEISIPADELPDTDDGLYVIRLSTNGCYNPQTEDGTGDDRDLALALTYVGAPFYPAVFGNAEDTEIVLEVFDGEQMLGTFSSTKENNTIIADAYDNPGYYSAGFRALIPDVFTDDFKIWVYVKYEGEFYRCSYHFEQNEYGTWLMRVSDID
jgi:hypothetical protein